MKKIGKYLIAAAAAGLLTAALSVNAFGATKKGIPTISLSFETEIFPGDTLDSDAVDITTKSENYYVGSQEFTNPVFSWDFTDVPEMKITLHAADEYRFTLTAAKDVKLTGGGAAYVKANKLDNWETLELIVKFSPLSESLGEVEEAKWASTGVASWNAVEGAGGYEVKLYRNGNSVGSSKVTEAVTYDFSSIMTRPASYHFRVRAVNATKSEIKSDWMESNMVTVDENQAALFRSGVTASGWKQDATGWWYQNADGTYTQNNWQQIGPNWYFFNESGYMRTGWIDWNGKSYFCTESGEMLMNTTTPDGQQVDGSGAKIG